MQQTAKSVTEEYMWGNTGLNKVKLVPLGLLQSLYCGVGEADFLKLLGHGILGAGQGGAIWRVESLIRLLFLSLVGNGRLGIRMRLSLAIQNKYSLSFS